jgi:type II secretory pathway component PulC
MQQNKTIPTALWIACLTIAAYVLAQTADLIVRRSFDAALKNEASVAQSPSERARSPLPSLKPPAEDKTAGVPKAAAGSGMKVRQVSDTEWILDRPSMLANTRNLNRFLMQASTVPYKKQGRIVGFRITRIEQGSLYEKIGLRKGDVLLRVNTRNLDDPAKLFSLYQEMRNKRHISLLLSRNGQDQTFNYDIR